MRDMRRIQEIVEDVMRTHKQARNSDRYLYYMVLKRLDRNSVTIRLDKFLLDGESLGYPKYDSVSRARRKVQRKYPELKACDTVQNMRNERKDEFEKYAKEEL